MSNGRSALTKPTLGMVALAEQWDADATALACPPPAAETFTALGTEAFRAAGRMVGQVMRGKAWTKQPRPPLSPSPAPSRL